ncbi:hypothetical protein CLV98_11346 [Dyadobacter jejuensis]|uniref:Uncharacterized protein n=1 Tax=Dyadobacter jejuensis TaxID=1082580 RepID=A0A316AF07_9BACT|nr:hypothetical protein [Dyadobacter jejuensis]PWJ55570.1 hypothetical protein CLV98_11346 [Dyadobacter jejuensis]
MTWAPAFGQLQQTDRLEIPTQSYSSEFFEVFTLGDQGLITLTRSERFSGKNQDWQFVKYDTTFQQLWSVGYRVDNKYVPIMAYQGEYAGFWLFVQPDTEHYFFLQLDYADGHFNSFQGDLLSGIEVQQFKVIGSKALVSGYYRSRPVVMVHSFFDHTTRVLPGLFEKNTEINNVEINEIDGYINVTTYAYRKRNCIFDIRTYNYEGKLLKKTTLSDPNYSVISGQIVPLNADDSYLIGNYSVGCTEYSQGLYVTHIRDNEPSQPEFIEFSRLQNFFNYLKPKRKAKILEKIGKRQRLGKENKFRYRLLVHDLIQREDEIVLVAEVYYPNQRTSTPIVSSGLSRQYYGRTMEGYKYTHAIVCAFDRQGKLLWDNCIAIKDLESYDLQQMVQVTPVDDYFILAYPQDGEIYTEVIRRNEVVVNSEKYKIKPNAEGEKILNDSESYLAPWYGQYFLAYGSHRLGASSMSFGREVYYINKLTYDTSEIGQVMEKDSGSDK